MRLSKNLHMLLEKYRAKLVCNIERTDDPIMGLNYLDYFKAGTVIKERLVKNESLSGADAKALNNDEFLPYLKKWLEETVPGAYLAEMHKNMTPEQGQKFIKEKGTEFYPVFRGYKFHQIGTYSHEQKATDNQLNVLKKHYVLMFQGEMSAREASQLIKSMNTPTRTKPFYWEYYIRGEKARE